MAKIKLQKIDYLLILVALMFVGLTLLAMYWPQKSLPGRAVLSLIIEEGVDVLDGKIKPGESVFLNGSNNSSRIDSVMREQEYLLVKISGPAEKSGEVFNFNGQRVLIGQKAELHGAFFARAIIKDFIYEK